MRFLKAIWSVYPVSLIISSLFACLPLFSRLPAQTCDNSVLTSKYWQYRERFNKHFIVTDRDSNGCIHDGIGFTPGDSASGCLFSKSGFSLPATSINMSPYGWGEPGNDAGRFHGDFEDHECLGDISWGNGNEPNHKFNWLDMGSETLTQLGWYLVVLSTEYELLGRNGQLEEQKKTLEDIFLALQAIRRLDMQAQCMLKKMYDSRRISGDWVCISPYTNSNALHNPFDPPPHRNYDIHVKEDCDFEPDFSGFNGFFLREDATQNLESFLHDSTSEMFNIDAVGSAYAVSTNDPNDSCTDVDRFCYMIHSQNFISHDQLINLFYGLSFVKKYIPPSATIVTCEGDTFNVLSIAQRITDGIVPRINDFGDHITVPGSEFCCDKIIKFTEGEGGNCRLTMYGLLLAAEYITGEKKRKTVMQQLGFEALLANGETGRIFYLKLSAMGKELSDISNSNQNNMVDIADSYNKTILMLGNDLLFPGGESMADKVGGQAFYKTMLCDAPCGGPCSKPATYGTGWPEEEGRWPDFECSNTPGWLGARWDGEGENISGVCSDFCVKVFFCPEFWRSNVLASRSLRRRSGTLSVEIQV